MRRLHAVDKDMAKLRRKKEVGAKRVIMYLWGLDSPSRGWRPLPSARRTFP
jgi:hypothetical protein